MASTLVLVSPLATASGLAAKTDVKVSVTHANTLVYVDVFLFPFVFFFPEWRALADFFPVRLLEEEDGRNDGFVLLLLAPERDLVLDRDLDDEDTDDDDIEEDVCASVDDDDVIDGIVPGFDCDLDGRFCLVMDDEEDRTD